MAKSRWHPKTISNKFECHILLATSYRFMLAKSIWHQAFCATPKKWNRSHFFSSAWIQLKFGIMFCWNVLYEWSKFWVDPISSFWDIVMEMDVGQNSLFSWKQQYLLNYWVKLYSKKSIQKSTFQLMLTENFMKFYQDLSKRQQVQF